ncbi:hypothetical protein EZV73_08180 [Acidaminobacter sp. JC074]|uniref:uroporphyrinogen decarboxylase family protein n=1 Tax=Acidaminobacter sp. JC074 TaxID=2530199 RepID=UPI001F0D44CE|nr:uroporphyrinogen decarboxylase family protein [Acidaminobacter sp. JC074]MCH4887546.1 hypothetical protein [Acidaminobacter sp. JC074]
MNSRERVLKAINHEEADRIPKYDGFWEQTVKMYEEDGLKDKLPQNEEIVIEGLKRRIGNPLEDYFDFDMDVLYIDTSLRMPFEILEEEEEFVKLKDRYGFTVQKFKDKSGSMHFLEHVTKEAEGWEKLKHRMIFDPKDEARIDNKSYFMHHEAYPSWQGFKTLYDAYRKREKFMIYACYGAWEGTWRHHGFEELMMDSILNKDMINEMMDYHTNLTIDTLKHAIEIGAKPDALWIMEDLGGTHTTLISRDQYIEMIKPHHKKLADFCHDNEMKFCMHSCGKIESFIEEFIDAGLDVLQAIQANTGMDVVELKKKYGNQLTFWGNIGETKLAGSKEDILEEISYKIPGAKAGGGYIYHSDHSIPDEVSLENYEYIMELVNKYGQY